MQGDINHWVAVLDHFDSFFEQQVSQRSDVQLQGEAAAEDPPFPTEACLAVLNTTCVLLENCSNKAAYNSSEVSSCSRNCRQEAVLGPCIASCLLSKPCLLTFACCCCLHCAALEQPAGSASTRSSSCSTADVSGAGAQDSPYHTALDTTGRPVSAPTVPQQGVGW